MEWIVSLIPDSAPDPIAALTDPPDGAGIAEIRMDLFPDLDLQTAVGASRLPVLFTLRSTTEGGRGPDDRETRARRIQEAWEAGAALLDLEFDRDLELIREFGIPSEQVVLSWHDHGGTPADLMAITDRMLAAPARWIKVVPTARSVADLVAVLALHRRFNGGQRARRRLVSFAMGNSGIASRYLSPLLGPPLGYAAWSGDAPAAPGQISIAAMEAVISHLDGPPQRLYGVIGENVSQSLSPVLHAAAYRKLGLPNLLLPITVTNPDELADLFTPRGSTVFEACGLDPWGWAVTTPYKSHAAAAADRHAPRVLRAAAANTLILGPEHVTAENTDADGVAGSLITMGVDPRGRIAVVQGTGGAARGAAVGLDLAGADVILRGRSAKTTAAIAEEIGVGHCASNEAPEGASILVNATPLGGDATDAVPFSDHEISVAKAIVDMVYTDHATELVAKAHEHGVAVADGREVLLHQGIAQFAAFNQTVPPKDAMRAALERRSNSKF